MIMRNYYLFGLLLIFFCSCNNHVEENKSIKDINSINNEILKVKLGDTRDQVLEKLTQQGYDWSELAGNISFISINNQVHFSGYFFDDVDFAIVNSRVGWIQLEKEYNSEESARKGFDEINQKLSEKYISYKIDKQNDAVILFNEYADRETDLTISLSYHPQEELPWYERDSDSIHGAREYWSVIIMYTSKDPSFEDNKTNDF